MRKKKRIIIQAHLTLIAWVTIEKILSTYPYSFGMSDNLIVFQLCEPVT